MKKLLLSIVLCVFVFNAYSQTTEEEYRYMQFGVTESINKGLELRKDIYCSKIVEDTIANKKAAIFTFNRETDKSIAGYLLKFANKENKNIYIAVPSPKSETKIYLTYLELISKLTIEERIAYLVLINKLILF